MINLDEAEQYLGMSMTYSIFEWVRENLETLLEAQPETIETVCDKLENVGLNQDNSDGKIILC